MREITMIERCQAELCVRHIGKKAANDKAVGLMAYHILVRMQPACIKAIPPVA